MNNKYEYILSLPSSDRINTLIKPSVKEYFLKPEAHNLFVSLVQELDGIELKYFIDSEYLDKIIHSPKAILKLDAIMQAKSDYKTEVLLDDKVLPIIIDPTVKLYYNFCFLDYRMGMKIIDYDLLHNTNHFYMLSQFSSEEQNKLFSQEYIIKLLGYNDLLSRFLVDLDGKIVNKLICYDKFLYMFLNLIPADINTIIENGFIIPKYLYNNKKFIDKYITLDTNKYRLYVNKLLKNNYEFYDIVEEERLKYIESKIKGIKDDMFKEYREYNNHKDIFRYDYRTSYKIFEYKNDDQKLSDYFRYKTKEQLLEMIIDIFFKDYPYNFLTNLKLILNYSKKNKNYIPKNMKIYNSILSFNDLSIEEITKLFDDNKDKQLDREFYNDFRLARNTSYNEFNNSIINLNNNLYKETVNEVDIYELNGEEFYLYVHSSSRGNWNNLGLTTSISLISHNNITTINNNNIIFGFSKLKIDNIMHVYHSDSYSTHMTGTNKVHDIETPSGLIEKTTSYNEILYQEEDDFKPDYVIAYDEYDEELITLAKTMNIPIILINAEVYKKKKNGIDDYLNNLYLDNKDKNDYEILEDIKKR